MDWFPLYNSLRVASISTFITFFAGIFAAYYISKMPRIVKGVLDCVLTLPLVLPPTVVGFFLLKTIGPLGPVGSRVLALWGFRMTMSWYSAIFATTVVAFPLMYRTARGAFEAFDVTLLYSGQTLGLSNTFIFWRVVMPNCKQGVLAGTVLSFARALGEYGATTMVTGYIPGRTAMISTTVYQLWREGNDALAYKWVGINLLISLVVLVSVNLLESSYAQPKKNAATERLSEFV
jgi:molybdate transport system permease protein